MPCKRCAADTQPANFGDTRRCAFDANGDFTPDNWNCATLSALPVDLNQDGCDESLQLTYVRSGQYDGDGWIVLTRYKHRGCCSSAVVVGDFWPARALTLADVERQLHVRHID